MIDKVKNFKKTLDVLQHLSTGEKAIACSLYMISPKSIRQTMLNFYKDQIVKQQVYIKEYKDKIGSIKKEY